jgi:multidrug efflux system membrane fusion protein
VIAPFDGVVSTQLAEIGTYLDVGDPIVRLVDLDPMIITAQVGERDAAHIARGSPAQATLITGQAVEGQVRFIAPEADGATRTFLVEVEIPNPERALADGVTAEVTVPLREVMAHRVPPSILTLRDDGAVGVMALAPDNTAEFAPVNVLTEDARGLWVAGLPRAVTLITIGQEFVTAGQSVQPIDEQTLAPAEEAPADTEAQRQMTGDPS